MGFEYHQGYVINGKRNAVILFPLKAFHCNSRTGQSDAQHHKNRSQQRPAPGEPPQGRGPPARSCQPPPARPTGRSPCRRGRGRRPCRGSPPVPSAPAREGRPALPAWRWSWFRLLCLQIPPCLDFGRIPWRPGFRDFPPHTKTPPIVPLGGVLCKVGSTFFASFPCMPLSSDVF